MKCSKGRILGGVLALTVFSSVPVHARQIKISSFVPNDQKQAFLNDLSTQLNVTEQDGALKGIMGVQNLDSSTLYQWLQDRVGFIVAEKEDLKSNLVVLQANYAYQNANVLPQLEKPVLAEIADLAGGPGGNPQPGQGQAMVMASNIGASMYFLGKTHSALLGYQLTTGNGVETVTLSSPRTGLIQIGQGLFLKTENTPLGTLFRLSILFHEARHSDGHAETLGFFHAICPPGHDYEGLAACDREINGPYAVGAFLLRDLSQTCQADGSCSAQDAERLAVLAEDSYSRILDKRVLDAAPEGLTP